MTGAIGRSPACSTRLTSVETGYAAGSSAGIERFDASFDDIWSVALPARRHRVRLDFEAEAGGTTAADAITVLLTQVPEIAD